MTSYITVVSGLPRSGTSMMMQMLKKGGIPVLTDRIRTPDKDNPHGYFELERVKTLQSGAGWLTEANGKAVKIISRLLFELPADHAYRIVFMLRHLPEVLASQQKMLQRLGHIDEQPSDKQMEKLFQKHLEETRIWLNRQPHMETMYISYNDIISDPRTHAEAVSRFLDRRLSVDRMVDAVDATLYRQQSHRGRPSGKNKHWSAPPLPLSPHSNRR